MWTWIWNDVTSDGRERGVIQNSVTGEYQYTDWRPLGDKAGIAALAQPLQDKLNAPPPSTPPAPVARWTWIWNDVSNDNQERGVLRNSVTGEERYTDWRPLGDKEAIRALAEPLGASLNNEPVSADFTNWLSGYNQRLADAEAARIAEANRVAEEKAAADRAAAEKAAADKAAADAANAAAAAAFADYWNRLFNPNPAPVVAEPAPATPVVAEPAPVTPTPATPAQVEAFNQLLQPPPTTPAPIPWVDRAKMINPNFDAAGYAARYSDLAAAFGSDAEKLAEHFVNYGELENRNPTAYTPKEKIATQLISQWQGLGTNVGIGSAGTPQAEIGGRPLQTVADEFAQKLVDKGITDLSQAKFDAGSQVSWTAEGNGNVSLIASPDGRLIPVWGSSSDASAIRSAAIAIALTFTGAGAAIGGAITSSLGVAASAATQALIGNIVVNTALNGGDIGAAVKSAIISSVGAEVGSMVGDAAKTMFDSAEGVKLISNVANNATKAVLSGGDAESVIVNTLVQGAVDFGTSKIPGFSDLPAPVKSTITQSINAAVQGKDIDYGTMLANAAKEGLLSYGLSQIPQFNDADTRTKSFITTMLRTAINDGDLSQAAVSWAVGQANQEFQRVLKAGPVLDELKNAGVISEASYYGLTDEQRQLVDSLATKPDPKAAASNYVNSLTTTDAEIRQFYKQITGKDATDQEADLLKTFVGMDEATARTGLDNQIRANIAADDVRLTKLQDVLRDPEATDQDLLTVMNEYTITPSFIQRVTSRSYDDLVMNMKGVTAGEAEAFAEKANLERPLTPDEVAMMQSGTRAQAANFAQRLSDLDQVTFRGDVFADQGAAELAAKQAGYNSYIYDGQTYMVNDRNIAASFDGGLLKETMRLITGALKAEGLTWEQAPPEKLQQLVNSAHAMYGNDVGALKGASIQDFLNGNTGTFDDIRTAYNNSLQGDGFRVEVRGVGYTSDTPDAQTRALPYLPPGVQLASSQEAFEANGATPIILSNGSVAWVKSKELPSQMDAVDYNVEILSPESASSTAPLQYLDYTSKLDPNKSTVNVSVINGAKAVVEAINKYGGGNAAALTDFASVVAQGSGELVKLASDLAWASGMVQRDNVVSRTADWLSKYGSSIQSTNTKQQEDNIINAVKSANGVVEKSKAFFRAAKDNPLGAITMVGKEAVQEIPMLIASGGVGRIVAGVAGKAIGFWAATGTDSVLNAGESFSANFGETYDNIKRAGGSDEYAKSQAYKSGAQAAVIGFGSNLIADSALVKAFMGDVTKITAGTFAKESGKQYVTEWGEEFLQNASVQYNSFGKVDWYQAQTAGAIGGAIGMGVASGIMSASAINYNMQVAVDTLGRPVTLQQVVDGSVQIQPGSLNTQAPIFDINGSGVSLDQISQATKLELTNPQFDINNFFSILDEMGNRGQISPNAANIALAYANNPDSNFLGAESSDISSFAAGEAGNKQAVVISVDDVFNTAVIGNQNGTKTIIDISGKNVTPGAVVTVNPNTLSVVNVVSGNEPTAPTKQSVVIEVDNVFNTATVWNQDGTKTVVDTAGANVLPGSIVSVNPGTSSIVSVVPTTPDETTAGGTGTAGQQTGSTTGAAAGTTGGTSTGATTPALQADLELRLSTAIQAARAAGVSGDAALQLGIDSVARDLGTTKQDFLTQMGATEQSLKTQFASEIGAVTTELGNVESRLTTAIEEAKTQGLQGDAALQQAINTVSSDLGTTKEALLGQIGKTEAQLRTEFATELGGVRTDLGLVESRLATAIQNARAEGMTGDAALQSAIDAVSLELGTSREALLGQIGKTETQLRNDFATELGGVRTELGNVESRLSAAIDAAKDAGISGDAVLQKAIDSVAADLGTSRDALLTQIGKTEETLRTDFAAQIAGVTTELGNVESRLTKAIDDAKASGLDSDAALQDAIDSVASDLGITKEALLGQIGKTEDQLRSDFSTQLGAVTTELGNVENRLATAIDAAKEAGLKGDEALQAAIDSVAADMGTTKDALLEQIGKTETQLRSDFTTELGTVKTELGAVESRLSDAIDAARKEGMTGDAALQDAIDAVALELGTSRDVLLGQIGKTEDQLRTDFSTQLSVVTTELGNVETRLNAAIDAAKAAGLDGDVALDAAIQSVSDDLGTTKEALLGQIGKTEEQLRSDFATQLSAVTTELGSVENRLKTAIDDAKAQGLAGDEALQSAIDAVAEDLGTSREALLGQIGKTETQLRSDFSTQLGAVTTELGNVETRLRDAISAAEESGLSRDQAIQAALDSVAADLGLTKTDLLSQIGKTEEALRSEFQTGLTGVEGRLAQAIQDAKDAGLQGDAALQSAIDTVSAQLGTTKEDLLGQIGKTETQLRSDFATQLGAVSTELGNVETRLQDAIAAAEARGLTRDQAIQSALDTVASDLGTTKADLLTQIGTTESTLRGEIEASQQALGEQIGSTEQRLTQAIADAEARGLTRDQAIQAGLDQVASDLGTTRQDLLTQLDQTQTALSGEIKASQETLGQQIVSTEQRVTDAIAAAEARGLTRDQAIQAGLDQVATDLGTTRQDVLSQLGTTADTLRGELAAAQTALGQQITTGLGGLSTDLAAAEARINERATQYEAAGLSRDQALSKAVGEVASQLGTTAQNLQQQISTAQTQLGEQIAGTKTDLQKQIDEAAELLGKPAQRVTQADLDYIDSVIKGTVTTAPDLSYDVNRDGKIDQTDFDYLQRVSTGSTGGGGEPPEFQAGTRWAPTGLFGEISGLRTDITTQLQQQELKRQQDAAKAKAEEEAARRRQTGLEMLKTPTAVAKQEALPQVSPLQTSGPSKFISPLAGFLAAVETGSYLQPKPQQPTMTPQPQQAQTDRYSYGKEQSIDSLLDPYGEQKQDQQSPFGFKAGGLAMGGGTRYGRFAAGGLNMVHHSGKARVDFRKGDAVTGPGDGQSDDIPAMLADGEYVIDSEIVAALGNGSTKAGSLLLDEFRKHIRSHKRGGSLDEIPPPSKSPLEYLAMAKKSIDKRVGKK